MNRLRIFIHNCFLGTACLLFSTPPGYALDIEQLRSHVNKGNSFMSRGSYQQAIDEYEAALQIEPDNSIARDNIVLAHNNWGIACFHQKKYEEAKAQWEQALKLSPHDRNAMQNLAVLKHTLAKLGIQATPKEKKEPPPEKRAEEADPETSAIKVLSPGFKQSPGASTNPSGISEYSPEDISPASMTNPSPDNVRILPPASTSESHPAMTPYVTPSQSPSQYAPAQSRSSSQSVPSSQSSSQYAPAQSRSSSQSVPSSQSSSQYAPAQSRSSSQSMAPSQSSSQPSSQYVPQSRSSSQYAPQYQSSYPTSPASSSGAAQPSTPVSSEQASTTQVEGSGEKGSQGTLEDKLGTMEMKIYGHKEESLPLMKRIEKLETDVSGKVRKGPIDQRVDALKKKCGL